MNKYVNTDRLREILTLEDGHKRLVGGLWDEIGRHQFQYLIDEGLAPEHRLLDVGCGSFRVGVHLIEYLEPSNYFGIDISQELMDAGYAREIADSHLEARFPASNYTQAADFDASGLGVSFGWMLAQSVFTHLPLNHLKLALLKLAAVAEPGARFYATFFLVDSPAEWVDPHLQPKLDSHTYPDRDPFHYTREDIFDVASRTAWEPSIIGDWGHLRNQSMVRFDRA